MRKTIVASLVALPLALGCTADPYEGQGVKPDGDGKWDASAVALFVDFEFDATVFTSSSYNPEGKIEDQLLFTIGQLNGENSVSRLDKLEISNLTSERDGDLTRITYHAKMPVAWGDKENVPTSYTLKLPQNISYNGQKSFTDAYSKSCVEYGAHDVDTGSMWYYYRPSRSGCRLAAEDVFDIEATVSVSPINTTGKFPEYDKVWEDDTLRVVAVWGKYEDGATSGSDAGISAYNKFVRAIKSELAPYDLVTTPADLPRSPGVNAPEVVFDATLANGKKVEIVALLVDNVRTAPAEFNRRYADLSSNADLIIYSGHAGLGANIRALARKGTWVTGQYAIVFMNGCDTYAYVDSALADAHAAANADDPTGTKYLDIVTNAMPSFFRSMSGASMALIRGLMNESSPKTYEQMFRNVDRSQVILVSGEEDNTFTPGGDAEEPTDSWSGLDESGTVARSKENHFETPALPAGTYVFELTGTKDADLYVRIGNAPTKSDFDCRPYKTSSNETCRVELTSPTKIHVMVRGWAQSSDWELVGGSDD